MIPVGDVNMIKKSFPHAKIFEFFLKFQIWVFQMRRKHGQLD